MTVITQKEATVNPLEAVFPVRLAMREVREAAYRALVARGASSSEAQAAARQVLFAEVHHGTGLRSLVALLHGGPWVREGLGYTRSTTPLGLCYAVNTTTSCNALLHGALLVDVASTGSGSEVLCNAVEHDSHLLDEALLNAAAASGLTVVHRSAGDDNPTTFATPAGELGIGRSAAGVGAPHTAPVRGYGSRFYTAHTAPEGVFEVSTSAERAAKRTELALKGILVDAGIWAEVRAVAAGYLVADA